MHRLSHGQIVLVLILCVFLLIGTAAPQARSEDELVATRRWSYPLNGAGAVTFAPDADRIFLGMGGARVEAVAVDGAKLWSSDLGGDIISNILPRKNTLFVATAGPATGDGKSGDGMLRALSRETGIT